MNLWQHDKPVLLCKSKLKYIYQGG